MRADERAQVAAPLPPQGQRAPGLDQHVAQARLAGQAVLTQVRREEEEAEVVDGAVVPARLQPAAQLAGGAEPLLVAGGLVEQPEDSGEEALAPVRPALALAA